MKNLRLLVAVPALLVAVAFCDASDASAGRFGLFRGRSASTPTYRPQRTWRIFQPTRTQTTTLRANGPRINGRHDWPGAIGTPSHRYQIFQDANGYWK